MHVYTRCKFCHSEIEPSDINNAYCDKECKSKKEIYGSVSNWRKQHKGGKKRGSRKTGEKRSKASPKPLKDHKQYAKSKNGKKANKGANSPYMIPIQAKNGNEYQQFLLIMDYGEATPLGLTGGSIPPQEDKNEEKKK